MSSAVQPLGLVKLAATPPAPTAGELLVYAKTDDKAYKQTSAGVESELGAGGGGGKAFALMMS